MTGRSRQWIVHNRSLLLEPSARIPASAPTQQWLLGSCAFSLFRPLQAIRLEGRCSEAGQFCGEDLALELGQCGRCLKIRAIGIAANKFSLNNRGCAECWPQSFARVKWKFSTVTGKVLTTMAKQV
jgi:hypothetical protein